MLKQTTVLVMVFTCWVAVLSASPALENRGAREMVLEGGITGAVPFPHLRHQDRLVDCTVCHSLFPQEEGSIEKLKAEGRLGSKQIMNAHCIKCHRDAKRAGQASGPVTCSQCHQKE